MTLSQNYFISSAAERDIEDILLSGVALFGEDQALRYAEGLKDRFAFLSQYPEAARLRVEISPPIRAYRYKSHLILYDIGEDGLIIIQRIRHGREDWMNEGT